MSDNYPPGVTGNEPQIAGGIAAEMVVSCEQGTVACLPAHIVTEATLGLAHLHLRYRKVLDKFSPADAASGPFAHRLQTLAILTTQLGQAVEILQGQIASNAQEIDWDCTMDGEEVEGEIIGPLFNWQCPACGLEQQTDLSPTPFDL